MIEISVHMKTLEKSIGRTNMRLARNMKIGDQWQGNSQLSPTGENMTKKNVMFNTLTERIDTNAELVAGQNGMLPSKVWEVAPAAKLQANMAIEILDDT
jgi:hypothetical protein